jgi:hypothetical protein
MRSSGAIPQTSMPARRDGGTSAPPAPPGLRTPPPSSRRAVLRDDALGGLLARSVEERVRMALPVIQRVIDPAAFARLDHSIVDVTPKPMARVTRADAIKCIARRATLPSLDYEVMAENAPNVWVQVAPAALEAGYTWPNEAVLYDLSSTFEADRTKRRQTKTRGADAVNQVGAGGAALTIREFRGDDLAMVHHTTGGGAEPHLTVENAHISALHYLADLRTMTGFDKGAKDKPAHELLMSGYGSAPTDNLNFFPRGGNQPVLDLSLAQYLGVIRYAMNHVPDVPPVFGEEVVRSANEMARLQGMDPTQLFLAAGVGMERQLFKAALNMHRMGVIVVPTPIANAFAGYAQPIPQLTDPLTNAVVRQAEAPWTELQNRLVNAHFANLLVYLKTL